MITLRQEVRQVARSLGLELTQQARITAAISAVARALIANNLHAIFQVHVYQDANPPRLAITCTSNYPDTITSDRIEKLERMFHVGEARLLVDEVALSINNTAAVLTMNILLERHNKS
ncbi:MAG: anti-sigma regulatory factor [Chloroflexaceae bacterium]|nr:anti-sigma regulatory factor [Chloroflexaceae bacterium]